MRARRFVLALLLLSLGSVIASWGGAAFSAGAPANASKNGCTCHSAVGLGNVGLEAPADFVRGQNYTLTVRILGSAPPGVTNQGGFALSADGGNLSATDDKVQIKDGMATHTTAGNDQRAWKVNWVAPTNATAKVTFSFAANAVNGDGVADPGDLWSRSARSLMAKNVTNSSSPAPTPTSPPPSSEEPSVGFVLGTAAIVAGFVWSRRRRERVT